MTDMDRAAMATITEPIKALNKHIERLENGPDDWHIAGDYSVMNNEEYIGELKRDRAGWIEHLRFDFSVT